MKLLVVEYINGGGLIGQELPPSLAAEGGLMLQALLDELKPLPDLTLLMPLDRRCCQLAVPDHCQVHWLEQTQSFYPLLQTLLAESDAIWPIAPETDGILAAIATMAQKAGKRLLLSDAASVALCADKLKTNQHLINAQIAAVETRTLSRNDTLPAYLPCVLKPRDGAGCEGSFIILQAEHYQQALAQIFPATASDSAQTKYVAQPLLPGNAISLSCLFKSGQGWLLSCNQQRIVIEDGHFHLNGCQVNVANPRHGFYQQLIGRVALAIPGLWGYVGIDLIETADHGPLVLEINPRLTTSYAGVGKATGINVAEQVLHLLEGDVELPPAQHLIVKITIN